MSLCIDRPRLRQIFPKFFVFRIVAVLGAQALERCDDFLLIHLHRVGDHTRGLFEADASIAVSAAHTRKDVEIFFLISHGNVPRGSGSVAFATIG